MNNEISLSIERVTNGPKHHLFGFHDLLISNALGDKMLSLEVDTINRPPLANERFGIGYVKEGEYHRIGTTTALNYPQGARQQWVADSDYFTVNNRVGDKWGTDLYDAASSKLIESFPATTHMLSKNGKYAYGLDYARLFRLGGYGYNGIIDKSADISMPSDSGITVMNLETQEVKLLVSVKEVAECGMTPSDIAHHYLTHLVLNPSSSRIAFLHRYALPDGGGMTRLMSIGVDGSGLRCLAQGMLSHFYWRNDQQIYIFGRANSSIDSIRSNPLFSNPFMGKSLQVAKTLVKFFIRRTGNGQGGKTFLMIDDSETPIIKPFAQSILTEDGHPMTCPTNSDWIVNDTYPNPEGIRTLMLYQFSSNQRFELGRFKMLNDRVDMSLENEFFSHVSPSALKNREGLAFTRSGLHCDLHPRWNRQGTEVVFDSIHEGSRQIYKVNVEGIIQ